MKRFLAKSKKDMLVFGRVKSSLISMRTEEIYEPLSSNVMSVSGSPTPWTSPLTSWTTRRLRRSVANGGGELSQV